MRPPPRHTLESFESGTGRSERTDVLRNQFEVAPAWRRKIERPRVIKKLTEWRRREEAGQTEERRRFERGKG